MKFILQRPGVWAAVCLLGVPFGCGKVTNTVATRAAGGNAGTMNTEVVAGAGPSAGGAGGADGGAAGSAGAKVVDCEPACDAGQGCVRGECVECSKALAPPFAASDAMQGGNSVAIADFSGDGRLDLAYTDFSFTDRAGLHFELGGDAGLVPQPVIAFPMVMPQPIIVGHADLDQDGSEDLLVERGSEDLQVFWGGAGGSSETSRVALTGQVAIGDFDGDRQLDLAVYSGENVTLAWGRQHRTFEIGDSSPLLKDATRLVAGDLNRDGKLDLTLVAPDKLQAFVGDGTGNFTARTLNDAPGLRDFALHDLDGDGRLDLVTSRAASAVDEPWVTGHVGVLYSFSDLLLTDTIRYQAGSGQSLFISDVNGDHQLDIVASNLLNSAADVLLGAGDGTFARRRAFSMGPGARAMALGDLNGDTAPDLAAVGSRRVIAYNRGKELFGQHVYPVPQYDADSVHLQDVTGDGYVDALVSNLFGNKLLLLAGTPSGELDEPEYVVNDASTGGASPPLAIADFDGDGRLEIATIRKDQLSLFRRSSSNHFELQSSSAWPGALSALVAGDLNEDGNPDLVAVSTEPLGSPVRVRLGLGGGEFGASSGYAVGERPNDAFLEDLNHDRHLDLVLSDYPSRSIFVMNGRGDGTFDAPTSVKTTGQPLKMQRGDLNADGWTDVVVTSYAGLSVLLGSAGGLQPEVLSPPTGTGPARTVPVEVALADFDGDGRLDVAAIEEANYQNTFVAETQVAILYGRGDGTLLEAVPYATETSAHALIAADLNGDGKPDLANLNRYGSTLSVLLNHAGCGD